MMVVQVILPFSVRSTFVLKKSCGVRCLTKGNGKNTYEVWKVISLQHAHLAG